MWIILNIELMLKMVSLYIFWPINIVNNWLFEYLGDVCEVYVSNKYIATCTYIFRSILNFSNIIITVMFCYSTNAISKYFLQYMCIKAHKIYIKVYTHEKFLRGVRIVSWAMVNTIYEILLSTMFQQRYEKHYTSINT